MYNYFCDEINGLIILQMPTNYNQNETCSQLVCMICDRSVKLRLQSCLERKLGELQYIYRDCSAY